MTTPAPMATATSSRLAVVRASSNSRAAAAARRSCSTAGAPDARAIVWKLRISGPSRIRRVLASRPACNALNALASSAMNAPKAVPSSASSARLRPPS